MAAGGIKIVVWHSGKMRSKLIASAMQAGISRHAKCYNFHERDFVKPMGDVAVFYGMAGNLRKIFRTYQKAGKKAVYIDLGYFGRKQGGRHEGFHKVSINARHPTAYFQNREHDGGRFDYFKIRPRDWVGSGEHILIAGMGPKAAEFEGYKTHEWEAAAVDMIRSASDRVIIYRPKPSWTEPEILPGTVFNDPRSPLFAVLRNCHAVVAHHSNVAIDGLIAGVPAFVDAGVAAPMALSDLTQIETPRRPDGRYEWLCNIAYTQWNREEMRRGECWRYLVEEGLV